MFPSRVLDIRRDRSEAFAVLPDRGNTIAIIPCLNEAAVIGSLVSRMHEHVARVAVVDDGSTDDTAGAARSAGAVVERWRTSLGKGAALSAGWNLASRLGGEWALLLDGDGQHDPAEAPKFFAGAAGGARLVIGDRMGQAEAMPGLRRWTNRWMSRRISALAGMEIPDSQCGYRLAHIPSLLALDLKTSRYEIESEMTVAFVKAGLPVSFVPVAVRYRGERSKISPLSDAFRWFRWYLRTRRRSRGVWSR